ncbi:DNA polymerase III subunit epsilon [Candidatus Fokinia crypta]|uniref:DNA polymerase III subunit epsilon n=1 Tax=Candidatus Fokinia crypta TaxID=1920990 RepID=A0ABZ0UQW7_9RICK|nr:DNA polymerase III subunit epsilon [Candidatus Fokinia cryptica]WPX97533.1 DNA polymerase III subunit epsilon [Candidatus Fokinia cryptica]
MREIVLDLETSGLNPEKGDKIIEIACIEVLDRKTIGESFHTYVNPNVTISEEAFKIHGISAEFLKKYSDFSKIVDEFLAFIGNSVLIIHNAKFDIKFLNHELGQIPNKRLISNKVIDTLQIAREKYPGAQNSLDALCRRFSISLNQREKHGALIDVNLLARVFMNMMAPTQNEILLTRTIHTEIQKVRDISKIPLSKEEKQKHINLIETLDLNLWKRK